MRSEYRGQAGAASKLGAPGATARSARALPPMLPHPTLLYPFPTLFHLVFSDAHARQVVARQQHAGGQRAGLLCRLLQHLPREGASKLHAGRGHSLGNGTPSVCWSLFNFHTPASACCRGCSRRFDSSMSKAAACAW